MKALSHAYLEELQAGEDPLRPAPYGRLVDQFDREKLSRRIGAALSGRAKAGRGKGGRP